MRASHYTYMNVSFIQLFGETEGQYISCLSKDPVLHQDSNPILFIDLDSNEPNHRFITDTFRNSINL